MVEYSYDSWGKVISTTGSLASTVGVQNPFRYRGYYYDTESNLYYLISRYYDPTTGRFISPDSIAQDGNLYTKASYSIAMRVNCTVKTIKREITFAWDEVVEFFRGN
jgi:RHS repeat-associated core domain